MRIRVQLIADGLYLVGDHSFDVEATPGVPAIVQVRDQAGNTQPDMPHVAIKTGYGRIAAHVTVRP